MDTKVVTTEVSETPVVGGVQQQQVVSREVIPDAQEFGLFKINQIVWYLIGLVNILIGLRFVLLLLSARSAQFTNFIYNLSYPFVYPFLGIFPSPVVETSYFETAALVAIVVYILLGFIINGLINILSKTGDVPS